MKTTFKLPVSLLLLTAPLAAYAETSPSTGVDALIGGFIGGFGGALLACWLCKRRKSKDDSDSKR